MFAEAPFSDTDDDKDSAHVSNNNNKKKRSNNNDGSSGSSDDVTTVHTLRFHAPGDAAYSIVAGACDDLTAMYDARVVSGDAWLSRECRCTRCESLRVMQALSRLQRRMSRYNNNNNKRAVADTVSVVAAAAAAALSPVLVLLDLDNYGFRHFTAPQQCVPCALWGGVFVWALYGSCFARYHGVVPSPETVTSLPSRNNNNNSNSDDDSSVLRTPRVSCRSIWQRLVHDGRVHFTPCGGQSQAVDGVMQHIAMAFAGHKNDDDDDDDENGGYAVVLVSGDTSLLRAIVPPPPPSSSTTSSSSLPPSWWRDRLACVSVHGCDGGKVSRVWAEIARCVAALHRRRATHTTSRACTPHTQRRRRSRATQQGSDEAATRRKRDE